MPSCNAPCLALHHPFKLRELPSGPEKKSLGEGRSCPPFTLNLSLTIPPATCLLCSAGQCRTEKPTGHCSAKLWCKNQIAIFLDKYLVQKSNRDIFRQIFPCCCCCNTHNAGQCRQCLT